jgi:exopolysaccharide production protein ExoY
MASRVTELGHRDEVVLDAGAIDVAHVLNQPDALTRSEPGPISEVRAWGARQGYAIAKRTFDLVFASAALMIFLPVWLVIAAAVLATSPGSILFCQPRCGRGGRTFTCLKFRTMVADAEAILRVDASLREAFAKTGKLYEDPRVTRVGRWLRKTSLDEIPQLLNVLRGEMSLVGPRPVQLDEIRDHYGHAAATVLSVTPGLTGLWQVSGRSNLTYAERVALDLEYVRQRGFWFDLAIILRTIPALLFGRGAV